MNDQPLHDQVSPGFNRFFRLREQSYCSDKSPDFNKKIKKIYLLAEGSTGAKEFCYSLEISLVHALFRQRGRV
jgi:hypothetical protein